MRIAALTLVEGIGVEMCDSLLRFILIGGSLLKVFVLRRNKTEINNEVC